jgi:ubiquinone/menaquinone biosynthesis C-methylase UbiE
VKLHAPWLAAAAFAATSVLAQESGGHAHDATIRHRFDDVEHWVKVFDDPARDEWQKPLDVIKFLRVPPGGRVADIGAGTGYFTVRLAEAVGPEGKVLAVEIEPGLVEHLRQRAERAGLTQVEAVAAEPADPRLPEAGVDVIFVCDTWHHIDARLRYLGLLARALKPSGRLVILDFREGDLPVGPPAGHKLSRDAVVRELRMAGWKLAAESRDLPYQYLLAFTPPLG